jgi:N-acetylmuramoyl-L-alanine amidase
MSGFRRILALTVCGLGLPCFGADLASFSVRVQDSLRVADVGLVQRQGVAYLSIPSLVGQVGGGCKITPGRVQVDLAEKTAWLIPNATHVTASLEDFTLSHPILTEGEDAFIALNDVPALFDRGFLLNIKRDTPTSLPPPPASPAAAPQPPAPVEPRPAVPAPPAEPQRTATRPIQVVVIDPGHGGNDPGCEGPGGAKESTLTLAIALKLKQSLEQGGIKVVLTRDTDRDLLRSERVAAATGGKGDLLVCLHAGAGLARAANGFEIFRCEEKAADSGSGKQNAPAHLGGEYAEQSRAMAESVAKTLAESTGVASRGVHAVPCAVVSGVAIPGLLIEVGVLGNATEESLLQADAHQTKIAEGIAAGIRHYTGGAKGAQP